MMNEKEKGFFVQFITLCVLLYKATKFYIKLNKNRISLFKSHTKTKMNKID